MRELESDKDMGWTKKRLWRGGYEVHLGLWILDLSEVVRLFWDLQLTRTIVYGVRTGAHVLGPRKGSTRAPRTTV